jgi:lysophospholipase L1-like esterase
MNRSSLVLTASLLFLGAAGCSSSSAADDATGDDTTGDTGGSAGATGVGGGAGTSVGTGGTAKKDGGGSGGTTASDSGPGPTDTSTGSGALALGSDGKLTIWTVGDSITNNSGARTEMCTKLTSLGYSAWFVGSLKGGGTPCNQNDNDGHSGFSISGLVDGVGDSMTVDDWYAGIKKPQLATLMIGTNNLAWWVADGTVMSDVADECMALVDKILGFDPKLVLIVGTIPPETSKVVAAINRDRADLVNEYNTALKAKVPAHAQYGKRLYLADINAVVTLADLAADNNGVHPNGAGQSRMGDQWLSVLTPLLPPAK